MTVGPTEDADRAKTIGTAAHIRGKAPEAARYDSEQTPDDRNSPANGIWLCRNHGTEIDYDDIAFPVELLEQWKKDHEARISEKFGQRMYAFENIAARAQDISQISFWQNSFWSSN